MIQTLDGNGANSTAATLAWLAITPNPTIRDLILIGDPEDPRSIRLTTHEAPVAYGAWGIFMPAVVTRDQVKMQIGLQSQSINLKWSPSNQTSTASTSTATVAQLARLHFYDNWPVRILRAFMPTPGDAQTLGCADWFAGRISTCEPGRDGITFKVVNFLDVLTQKVPSTVVEVTNTLASSAGSTLPAGNTDIPVFKCFTGSTENYIIADSISPLVNNVYSGNEFVGGYMVFLSGTGATLAGCWSAIGQNGKFTDGNNNEHSEFQIYAPLPWPPAAGVDTFYVSWAAPMNLGDQGYFGFPYVPSPQSAV